VIGIGVVDVRNSPCAETEELINDDENDESREHGKP